jgi:hypothetical protein
VSSGCGMGRFPIVLVALNDIGSRQRAQPPSPSLRANGSRECAPDDRLREAIHLTAWARMDCFVA